MHRHFARRNRRRLFVPRVEAQYAVKTLLNFNTGGAHFHGTPNNAPFNDLLIHALGNIYGTCTGLQHL